MPKVRIDDSLEMHYEDDNFTDPWKTPETVILQHCNAGSTKLYYRWVPAIAGHYRLIRVDRRGQGQSTVPPPGRDWSLAEWAQEMDVLLDRLGLEQVHLIGEATGSFACLQHAYEHPERVKSLTLINCAANFAGVPIMSEGVKMVEEQGAEGYIRNSMKYRFDASKVDPDFIQWHLQEKLKQPQQVSAEVKVFMSTKTDVTDMLPDVRVPTLVITGEGHAFHTEENGRRLQELIPNCKLVTISGDSSYVAHSSPEKCAAVWLDFVRGLN